MVAVVEYRPGHAHHHIARAERDDALTFGKADLTLDADDEYNHVDFTGFIIAVGASKSVAESYPAVLVDNIPRKVAIHHIFEIQWSDRFFIIGHIDSFLCKFKLFVLMDYGLKQRKISIFCAKNGRKVAQDATTIFGVFLTIASSVLFSTFVSKTRYYEKTLLLVTAASYIALQGEYGGD